MDRGLYVTELMGQGVNGVTGDYSRGAAGFWVENGELAFPVHEVTIAGNLKDMYREIVDVGNDIDRARRRAHRLDPGEPDDDRGRLSRSRRALARRCATVTRSRSVWPRRSQRTASSARVAAASASRTRARFWTTRIRRFMTDRVEYRAERDGLEIACGRERFILGGQHRPWSSRSVTTSLITTPGTLSRSASSLSVQRACPLRTAGRPGT